MHWVHTHTHTHQRYSKTQLRSTNVNSSNGISSYKTCKIVSHTVFHIFFIFHFRLKKRLLRQILNECVCSMCRVMTKTFLMLIYTETTTYSYRYRSVYEATTTFIENCLFSVVFLFVFVTIVYSHNQFDTSYDTLYLTTFVGSK